MKINLGYKKWRDKYKPFPLRKKTFLGKTYQKHEQWMMDIDLSKIMYSTSYSKLEKRQKEQISCFSHVIECFEDELYKESKEVVYLKKWIEIIEDRLSQKEEELEAQRIIANRKPIIFRDESQKKTYLIKESNTSYYKIGKSNNPEHREKTLQREMPNIKTVKVWEEDIEKELHHKYAEHRVRGEWFKLTKPQVKYICTHY